MWSRHGWCEGERERELERGREREREIERGRKMDFTGKQDMQEEVGHILIGRGIYTRYES